MDKEGKRNRVDDSKGRRGKRECKNDRSRNAREKIVEGRNEERKNY